MLRPVPSRLSTRLRDSSPAAYSGDSLWVSVFGAGKVARVDPSTAAVTQQVEVGPEPAEITDGFGS